MHAAIGYKTEQVQTAFAGARVFHRLQQNRVRKQFSVLDHQIDAGDVHVNDAASADVEMADFAVTHLSFRQPNVRATGVNQGVGILAQQAVISRLARERDGVGFGFGAVSPAVEDGQNKRFRSGQN